MCALWCGRTGRQKGLWMRRKQNPIFWRISLLCALLCYNPSYPTGAPPSSFCSLRLSDWPSPHFVLPELLIPELVYPPRPLPAPALCLSTISFQPLLRRTPFFSQLPLRGTFPPRSPSGPRPWLQALRPEETLFGPGATTHLTNFSPWDGARTLHRNRKPSDRPTACRRYRHRRRHAAVLHTWRWRAGPRSRSRSSRFPGGLAHASWNLKVAPGKLSTTSVSPAKSIN